MKFKKIPSASRFLECIESENIHPENKDIFLKVYDFLNHLTDSKNLGYLVEMDEEAFKLFEKISAKIGTKEQKNIKN